MLIKYLRACTFTTFVAYLVQSNFQFPGLDSTSPVIGIVFCLIIVRVGLGVGHQPSSGNVITHDREAGIGVRSTNVAMSPEYPMRPLAVNITRQARQDGDDDFIAKDKFVQSTLSCD